MRRRYLIELDIEDTDGRMTPEDVALMLDCFLGKRGAGDEDFKPQDWNGREGVCVHELTRPEGATT